MAICAPIAPASAAPTAAKGSFPYPHPTLDQVSTADPARWREAHRAHFDAIYGPEERHLNRAGQLANRTYGVQQRLEAARAWRIANKPMFDALYGALGDAA